MSVNAAPASRSGGTTLGSRWLAAVVAAALAAGCYGGESTPTPGGTTEVMQELTRSGLRIEGAVSGDAGCGSTSLSDNAVHLRVTLPPDTTIRDVYLFTFRSTAYDGGAALVDDCQAALGAAGAGPTVRVDVAPFRAFGPGWPPALRDVVTRALAAAAQGG